jgi:hypothetical protein
MYKKVYHHVTEEHFHHPHAVHIAAEVAKHDTHNPLHKSGFHPHKHKSSMSDSEALYVAETLSAWANLIWRLRHFVVSTTGNSPDLNSVNQQILDDSSAIDALIVPYESSAEGAEFSSSLKNMVSAICAEITATKNNTNTPVVKHHTSHTINKFANTVAGLYPPHWYVSNIEHAWTKAKDSLVSQAQHRLKQEWAADNSLVNHLHGIVVSGNASHPEGFAEALAHNIIKKSPSKFKG